MQDNPFGDDDGGLGDELLSDSLERAQDALPSIAALAQMQREQSATVADLEDQLKLAKEALRETEERLLPTAMLAVGMSRFDLEDGTQVVVDDFVEASIRVDDRPAAFQWLAENGFGDLVKHEVKVTFGKGESEDAAQAVRRLREMGLEPADNESVHAGTLKAWAKEQIAQAMEGGAIPEFPPSISVYQGKRAKIAAPKARKGR